MSTTVSDTRFAQTGTLREGDEPVDESTPALVANRYALGETLGQGGFGSVYRAVDTLTGDAVALKLLHAREGDDAAQFRSEVSLLRLLRLPNLVHLLDDGVDGGRPFLVTEMVDGAAFPGVPVPALWEEIETTTRQLLDAVARVHAYGVVHRDLKPANVLVGADGTPVVLDFGVSFGPGYSTSADGGYVVGTPAYLSPEQALGERGSERSDLYAIGVMLYEALTGELPHTGSSLRELLRAKQAGPTPVRALAPEVPAHVASTIDALLIPHFESRPPDVATVLSMLGVTPAEHTLPRLGSSMTLDRAVSALLAGESVEVRGGRGMGRSRLLRDIAGRLSEAGRESWAMRPSRNRWGSLPVELRRQVARLTNATDSIIVHVLRDAAARGVVILCDDAQKLDRDTRAAVVQSGIAAVWVDESVDAVVVHVRPLEAADLRTLFHGPNLLLQLCDDAARLAFDRTGGRPSTLTELLDAWVRAGLGYWEDGKIRMSRQSIARLESGLRVFAETEPELDSTDKQLLSWVTLAGATATREVLSDVLASASADVSMDVDILIAEGRLLERPNGMLVPLESPPSGPGMYNTLRREAHWAIGEASPPGSPGRLVHLIQARDGERIVAEARAVADDALRGGQLEQGFAALREAVAFVRALGLRNDEADLLKLLTLVAIEMQSARAIDLALYEVERGRAAGEDVSALAELLDVTRLVRFVERDRQRAFEAARTLAPFAADVRLEKWRRATLMTSGSALGAEELLALANEQLRWAESQGDSAVIAAVRGWVGLALYRCARYAEAAESHEAAAARAGSVTHRAAALTNAASCWLEAQQRQRATLAAGEALRLAETYRLLHVGCRALWLGRSIRLRFGETLAPEPEALEVYALCDEMPTLYAKALEVEAAGAWRRGDHETARVLAGRSASCFRAMNHRTGAMLMSALEIASTESDRAAAIAAVIADAQQADGSIRLQTLALLADRSPQARARLKTALEQFPPPPNPSFRWEVFSFSECADRAG